MPAKLLLTALNVNDLQSFQITNALLFIIMIWLLYFKLKLPTSQKNALILLLIFNPILYYIDWTHPEVFTYVFVVLSLMFYHNKQYKLFYLLMAIASWQNPPVIFLALLVYAVKFFRYLKEKDYKNILGDGFALSVFLIPMIFYFYNYGVLNLIAAKGFSSIKYISFIKVWDLYFGLQHGMVLFSSIVLIAFFWLLLKKLIIKKFTTTDILYVLSILAMSIIVTTAPNWNCGMNFVIRYSLWIYAFIVYFVAINLNIRTLTVVSILNTFLFLIIYSTYTNFSYVRFNSLSNYLLSNYPSLYITTQDTFAENELHREVNFYKLLPIFHQNSDDEITKILTDYKALEKMLESNQYKISKRYRSILLEKYKNKKGLFFINIPLGEMYINTDIYPREVINFVDNRIKYIGWSTPEKTHRWSLGSSSKIEFKTEKINNYKGLIHFNIGSLGEQEITVYLNEKQIGSKKINGWNLNLTFTFDPKLLIDNKKNIIKFVYSNAHKPNNGDQRVLAMALKSFSIE